MPFDIRESEVFDITGVDGNDQPWLVEIIAGLRTPTEGSISYKGRDIADASRRPHVDGGIAYVPEDRHERELVIDFDLVQSDTFGSQHNPSFAAVDRIYWSGARRHTKRIIDEYNARPSHAGAGAEFFSGGNQQKPIVDRGFERDPGLVVATYPTRGVGIGAMESAHEQLLDLRVEGRTVLLTSSKLDEVQGPSDHLSVMHDGEPMDIVDPCNIIGEEIGLLMAGKCLNAGATDAEPLAGDAK